MDIKSLSYFVTVAEELNISHAAEKLMMSQPPLSYQIKSLEEELGTKLFIRGKRTLSMTETGQLLYRRAKEILSLVRKAEEEIISMESGGMKGTVSIGLVEGTAPHIAGEWFAGFYSMYPGVRFRILDGNSDDLVEKLRSGLISLAVITAPCDGLLLNSFKVGQEPMMAFFHPDHRLADRQGGIEVRDLIGEPLIVPSRRAVIDMIYRWFREYGSEPNIVCEMDSYLDAAALAERRMGISIFPQTAYVPNPSLVVREITGTNRYLEYLFAWRKGRPLPHVEEHFIDFVKSIVGET